jgi:nicotinamidase-related amidase
VNKVENVSPNQGEKRYAKNEFPLGHGQPLAPDKTALIVVDMQNDFVAKEAPFCIDAAREMLPTFRQTLQFCRENGVLVIYTAHVHREDGCDMGPMAQIFPLIGDRESLIDGTWGGEVVDDVKPEPGEHVIRKRRFDGFFATDLDMILRGSGIENVVITGVSTEGCAHATARGALYHNYQVVFLADCTATFDYPDMGYGAMAAEDVHRSALVVLAKSTAQVTSAAQFMSMVEAACTETTD